MPPVMHILRALSCWRHPLARTAGRRRGGAGSGARRARGVAGRAPGRLQRRRRRGHARASFAPAGRATGAPAAAGRAPGTRPRSHGGTRPLFGACSGLLAGPACQTPGRTRGQGAPQRCTESVGHYGMLAACTGARGGQAPPAQRPSALLHSRLQPVRARAGALRRPAVAAGLAACAAGCGAGRGGRRPRRGRPRRPRLAQLAGVAAAGARPRLPAVARVGRACRPTPRAMRARSCRGFLLLAVVKDPTLNLS